MSFAKMDGGDCKFNQYDNMTNESKSYPCVEAAEDGYIIRLDDGINWYHLTTQEAKQLCAALLEHGPGASQEMGAMSESADERITFLREGQTW